MNQKKIDMCVEGIFENMLTGDFYWLDGLDDDEVKNARFFADWHNSAGYHECNKSALYDNMTEYIDELQNEKYLADTELYVVTYNHAFIDGGQWNLEGLVDFGVTKQEIIENVKNQRYVEGATYYTMGQMLYTTTEIIKDVLS